MPVDSPDACHDPSGRVEAGGARGHRAGPLRRLRRPEPHSERYYFLLGLLLVDVCVIGFAGARRRATFVYTPLTAATLLLALRTSEAQRRTMRIAWVAAAVAVTASAAAAITGPTRLNGHVYFMLFALLLLSPLAIGRRIIMSRRLWSQVRSAAVIVSPSRAAAAESCSMPYSVKARRRPPS